MLNVAGRGEFRNLRAEHERVVAAATDAEEAQRRRAPGPAPAHLDPRGRDPRRVSGPTTEVHRLLDALEPLRKQAFDRGRTEGPRESQDAYLFDALIGLASGERAETVPATPVALRARRHQPAAQGHDRAWGDV